LKFTLSVITLPLLHLFEPNLIEADNGVTGSDLPSKFAYAEIQDGGHHHFEIS